MSDRASALGIGERPPSNAPEPRRAGVGAWIGVTVCAAIIAASLVVTWRMMRMVMEVGGACASGGPYEIATPCPEGVALLMGVGIPVGVFAVFAYLAFAWRIGGGLSRLVVLGWPVLFLSLGWNFLAFAFNPPDHADGPVIGWLVCGVIFVLMALPVLFVMPKIVGTVLRHRPVALIVIADALVVGGIGGWLLVSAVA